MAGRFFIGRTSCTTLFFGLTDGRTIDPFVDAIEISSLPAQPLYEDVTLKTMFKARGERFVALRGRHHLQYNGLMIDINTYGPGISPNPVGVTKGLGGFRVIPPI